MKCGARYVFHSGSFVCDGEYGHANKDLVADTGLPRSELTRVTIHAENYYYKGSTWWREDCEEHRPGPKYKSNERPKRGRKKSAAAAAMFGKEG